MALSAQSAPTERNAHNERVSALIIHISKWMGFLSGLALIVAVALIPPAADLDSMRLTRDRVLALEQTDLTRIQNYEAFRDALDARRPDTIRLVLAAQLQLVPRGQTALVLPGLPEDPRLFELLEPPPTVLPKSVAPTVPSRLTRMASSEIGRLALIGLATLAIIWGFLPPASEPAAH
jgi:hypothetical protein